MISPDRMSDFLAEANKVLGSIDTNMKVIETEQKAQREMMERSLAAHREILEASIAAQNVKIVSLTDSMKQTRNFLISIATVVVLGAFTLGVKSDDIIDSEIQKKGYATEQKVLQGFGDVVNSQSDIGREAGVDESVISRIEGKTKENIGESFGYINRGNKKDK